MQDDSSLGEPDWDEVINSTALDIGQLLPSKQELKAALERMGCDVEGCADAWEQTMEEVDTHVRSGGAVGLRSRRSIFAVQGKGTPHSKGTPRAGDPAGAATNGDDSRPMMRPSLSFNVLNRVRNTATAVCVFPRAHARTRDAEHGPRRLRHRHGCIRWTLHSLSQTPLDTGLFRRLGLSSMTHLWPAQPTIDAANVPGGCARRVPGAARRRAQRLSHIAGRVLQHALRKPANGQRKKISNAHCIAGSLI